MLKLYIYGFTNKLVSSENSAAGTHFSIIIVKAHERSGL